MILAIDTTSEFGSVALARGEHIVEEVLLHSPDGFGHILFGHIEQLLARAGQNVKDIICFAAASGPGSFTGVRVGLTAIKGLAEACGRPAIAVSNLQALAWFGSAPLRATVLDARRGEIYGAVYGADLEVMIPETVCKFSDWLKTLPAGDLEFIATGFGPFRAFVDPALPVITAPRALAGAIARIALRRFEAGEVGDPAAIDANYVRRSDAELLWKN